MADERLGREAGREQEFGGGEQAGGGPGAAIDGWGLHIDLYHQMGIREFEPSKGRFLSLDPRDVSCTFLTIYSSPDFALVE
jgi:hypothetical protein